MPRKQTIAVYVTPIQLRAYHPNGPGNRGFSETHVGFRVYVSKTYGLGTVIIRIALWASFTVVTRRNPKESDE